MRKCTIILTPDNESERVNVQTGTVTNLEVLEALQVLSKHFAREICKEYAEITGDKNVDPMSLR